MKNQLAMLVLSIVLAWPMSSARADFIYVVGTGHSSISTAVGYRNTLGHSVTNSAMPLSDYSGYDQVWDLKYYEELTATDRTALSNFLSSGGGVYLSGDNSAFDARNSPINVFLDQIEAGAVSFVSNNGQGWKDQDITSAGQVVSNPNSYSLITTYYTRRVSAPSNGFLVSESVDYQGSGSLVGWDFGDLPHHAQSRMLASFDMAILELNGIGGARIPRPTWGLRRSWNREAPAWPCWPRFVYWADTGRELNQKCGCSGSPA